MARSGAFWANDLSKFTGSLTASTEEMASKLAVQVFDEAVKRSPVFSGSYKASWNISKDGPDYIYNDIHNAPFSRSASRSSEYKNFKRLYVTNGAPYGVMLEYGWSDQAPQGVLRQILSSMP
ncbi:MAG: hypothetical protein WAT79_10415 [Saprospiraceae bacterium]